MNVNLKNLELNSATFDELLSSRFTSLPGKKADSAQAVRRLEAWCCASTGGDWNLFAKRLARDGLTFETVLSRFATSTRNNEAPIAPWIEDWMWICESLTIRSSDEVPDHLFQRYAIIPFASLLKNPVQAARKRMLSNAKFSQPDNIQRSALDDLCISLMRRLSDLCSPALYEQLVKWRTDHVLSSNATSQSPGMDEDLLFQQFLAFMRDAGFQELFRLRPVLLRLIAITIGQWIDVTAEFLNRFQSDHEEVRRLIAGHNDKCALTAIRCGLSDLHNHGRSVWLLEFTDNSRVLYKPKDLRPDEIMFRLIARLNDRNPPTMLRIPRVLARNNYGWVEFIQHAETPGTAAASQFYARAGAWLVLFHLLCAADMHLENMIAAGDHPVPIDFEMICQPEDLDLEEDVSERQALQEARKCIADSVLAVGLLPAFARTAKNEVVDLGGFSGRIQIEDELHWVDIDSIRMRPTRQTRNAGVGTNMPVCGGIPLKLSTYSDSLQKGFEEYGRFLIEHGKALLEERFLNELAQVPLRVLIRPTRFYAHLLERMKDVRKMEDGTSWSVELDFPSRLADWDRAEEQLWPIIRAERNALAELNIPYFFVCADTSYLADVDGPILNTKKNSGIKRAFDRIRNFDGVELKWQSDVVRMSLSSIPNSPHQSTPETRLSAPPLNWVYRESLKEVLERGADSCYAKIRQHAIWNGHGAAWVGADWLGDSEACQLVPLGMDLYNGSTGIAVFLAAYARHKASAEAADLCLAGLAPVRSYLKGLNAPRIARSLGVGGASGLGSIVYALTVIGQLLDREDIVSDAVTVSRLITGELLQTDKSFDLIGGSAGAILGLCKLYRTNGCVKIFEIAVKCADHLMGNMPCSRHRNSARIHDNKGTPILTGAAHGASGMAMSLGTMYQATGDRKYADSAEYLVSYENTLFSAVHSNWPDLRDGVTTCAFPCQWCYGAGGIGLARVALLRCGAGERVTLLADVQHALDCVLKMRTSNDTLCCGDLGNIEFLKEAGETLGETQQFQSAETWMANLILQAEERGDYRWLNGNQQFSLGLFRGTAGVGYTALRRLHHSLPNLLIWE